MLHHYHVAGFITTEDCSVRSLKGGRKEDEGAGLIDIITFKKRILSHYMDVVLPNQHMPSERREAFRETCQSISQYCKRSPTKAHGVLIYYNIIELICNWYGTEFELSSGPPQPPRPPGRPEAQAAARAIAFAFGSFAFYAKRKRIDV